MTVRKARLVRKGRGKRAAKVELYEDNAGHLFAIRDDADEGFGELEQIGGGAFADDAQAMLDGDTQDFNVEWVGREEIEDQTELVATYENGSIQTVGSPGLAALDYAGLERETSRRSYRNPRRASRKTPRLVEKRAEHSADEISDDAYAQGEEDSEMGRRRRSREELADIYGNSDPGLYDSYANGYEGRGFGPNRHASRRFSRKTPRLVLRRRQSRGRRRRADVDDGTPDPYADENIQTLLGFEDETNFIEGEPADQPDMISSSDDPIDIDHADEYRPDREEVAREDSWLENGPEVEPADPPHEDERVTLTRRRAKRLRSQARAGRGRGKRADRQSNDLGYDDGLAGRPMMTKEEWGRSKGYDDYVRGYEQGEADSGTSEDPRQQYRARTGRDRSKRAAKVELYEDNAGHLFAIRDDADEGFGELEQIGGGAFADDAQAMLDGDTQDFNVERVGREEIEDQTELVATYENGNIQTVGSPGGAAQDYMGSEREASGRKVKKQAGRGRGKRAAFQYEVGDLVTVDKEGGEGPKSGVVEGREEDRKGLNNYRIRVAPEGSGSIVWAGEHHMKLAKKQAGVNAPENPLDYQRRMQEAAKLADLRLTAGLISEERYWDEVFGLSEKHSATELKARADEDTRLIHASQGAVKKASLSRGSFKGASRRAPNMSALAGYTPELAGVPQEPEVSDVSAIFGG